MIDYTRVEKLHMKKKYIIYIEKPKRRTKKKEKEKESGKISCDTLGDSKNLRLTFCISRA